MIGLSQLQPFLNANKIFDSFQLGFKTHYSSETALFMVTNDLLISVDTRENAIRRFY